MKRPAQVRWTAFEKQLHIAHRFLISLRRGQFLHARAQTALDVVLQTRARVKTGEIDFAGGDQEISMNEIENAVRQIGREVRAVVGAAVLAQAAGDVDARRALSQSQFYVRVSLIVAQKDVEARFALLDE